MTGTTQTIDTYHAGMSQQPDLKKFPGQVKDIVNGVPDVTEGLYKRPGSKRIGASKLGNVSSVGSFFHYYRDDTEGSYIGQVSSVGRVRMWSCKDGVEKTVYYHTSGSEYNSGIGSHTNITDYLTPSTVDGVVQTEDIQALTINDTTFLNNRSKTVVMDSATSASAPHTNYAFVELLRTENGRQYGLNIHDDNTRKRLRRATRLKITADTLDEGNETGTCPGIGTQVYSVSAKANSSVSYSTESDIIWVKSSSNTQLYESNGRQNLIFRITTLGQSGQSQGYHDEGVAADRFSCSYSRDVQLLHGGEDWQEGDKVQVRLSNAKGGANSNTLGSDNSDNYATYTVTVMEIEETWTNCQFDSSNLGNKAGLIRPTPTPFDADTAVTPDTILGGIEDALPTGVEGVIVGNGIYLYNNDKPFNVEVVDTDLMRVMHDSVDSVDKLPNQCRDGYIVKVLNSSQSQEDDYYLKFETDSNVNFGTGTWTECAKPGITISLDRNEMPHILQRQSDGTFLVKKNTWGSRTVGDDDTNPLPSFVGNTINKILFFRNRLAILSGENLILSRPGELINPNPPTFFIKTALTVSSVDPIDIASSSEFPSDLFDGIETAAGLLVFSTNQQFLFSSDAEILNPDTAKLRSVSTYNYNKDIPPISLGVTTGYIDNSGKYSRFNEMANTQREVEPTVIETSKIVPTLLEKDINLIANSKENQIVFFGKNDSDTVYVYKYLQSGEERQQAAWFKWKLNRNIRYHFVTNDNYYFLDDDNFLQQISLVQADPDPSIDENKVNYLIHLDNWTTVNDGVYSDSTDLTTFSGQSWLNKVTTPTNGSLAIIDTDNNNSSVGRYSDECVVDGTSFTVPGNWDYNEEFDVPSSDTEIDITNQKIRLVAEGDHEINTGDKVRYLKGDTRIEGLLNDTVYYAIRINKLKIALATTKANAESGNNITITSLGAGTHRFQNLMENLHVGYLYQYSVSFPKIYPIQIQGQRAKADVNAYLTLHRLKFNFGKSGLYTTTLKRLGKADYSETHESSYADAYLASDAPYVSDQIKTIPIYENSDNVEITLKSTHPSPAVLHAMTWEGDYSTKNYRRV